MFRILLSFIRHVYILYCSARCLLIMHHMNDECLVSILFSAENSSLSQTALFLSVSSSHIRLLIHCNTSICGIYAFDRPIIIKVSGDSELKKLNIIIGLIGA